MISPATTAIVLEPDGTERTIRPRGRDAWALRELVAAGPAGCTPIDNPGPRWSGYVFNLRRQFGLNIDTVHESHRGQFPGSHARYVLRSRVRIVEDTNGGRRVGAIETADRENAA